MKYKTFNEIKKGDSLYYIEISNLDCQFKEFKVREFLENFHTDKIIETYISDSPLSFSFERNKSSWHGMIFTTKDEAIQSAKKQINKKIKEHLELVNGFLEILNNIENVKFKYEE